MKENEFKVGDYVRLIYKSHKRPYKVLEVMENEVLLNTQEYPKRDNIWKIKDCNHWTPEQGEYCWFINTTCAPILAKFVERQCKTLWFNSEYKTILGYKADKFGHYSGNIGPQEEDYIFPFCKPFIGELPE